MEMQDSIPATTMWQAAEEAVANAGRSVQEVVETEETTTVQTVAAERPQKTVASRPVVHAHKGVPQFLSFPYAGKELPINELPTAEADTAVAAEQAVDSVKTVEGESVSGIVLVDPTAKYAKPQTSHMHFAWGSGMSWVYLALVVLFCAIAYKFKGSKKYMKALYKDLVDTRVRHNLFDDTVRETSLLVLLNLLWAVCFGVLLWSALGLAHAYLPQLSNVVIPDKPGIEIGICIGVAAVYMAILLLAYWVVGSVFSDRNETRLWFKGAVSANALETFILFPCALLTLTCPQWSLPLLGIAAVAFIMGKIVFLYKGFRIFFNEISSWLLFLYYLCSLEIIPLLLAFVAALFLCSHWL